MDNSAYNNYRLVRETLNFVRRVKKENPELWAQIQAEAAQAEKEVHTHAEKMQALTSTRRS